jgi:hypothetical protein
MTVRGCSIGWYWSALHAGKSFSSIGLAPLIAKMGFPIPVALAIWITFNESIGAFLIGRGFLTRLLAASLALGMAGALYTSVQLGEDWLRAALYLIIFFNSFGIVAAACAASLLSIALTHAARPPGARVETFAKLPDFLGNPADGWVTRLLRFCLPDRPAPQTRRFVSRV